MNMTVPDHLRLQVVHLHPANSSRHQRKNSVYRTIARLFDKDTDELIREASSKCSDLDIPDRKRGYQVAVGRVLQPFNRPHVTEAHDE